MKKPIRFSKNVEYGGLIKKGTLGWIDEDEEVLVIPPPSVLGAPLSKEVLIKWPKQFLPELLPLYSAIEVLSESKKGSSVNSEIRSAIETVIEAGFSVRKELPHTTYWITSSFSPTPNKPYYSVYKEEDGSLTAPQFDTLDEAIENLLEELPYGLVKKLLAEEVLTLE